jgi:hypothetical protein
MPSPHAETSLRHNHKRHLRQSDKCLTAIPPVEQQHQVMGKAEEQEEQGYNSSSVDSSDNGNDNGDDSINNPTLFPNYLIPPRSYTARSDSTVPAFAGMQVYDTAECCTGRLYCSVIIRMYAIDSIAIQSDDDDDDNVSILHNTE